MRTGNFVGSIETSSAAHIGVGRLELRTVGSGEQAHFLDGRRVSAGERVELLLAGGQWLAGRYEWSGNEARWPALRVELGGEWEVLPAGVWRPAAVLAVHPDAILRWPNQQRR